MRKLCGYLLVVAPFLFGWMFAIIEYGIPALALFPLTITVSIQAMSAGVKILEED